jgi:diguanylate cyclase (GGDEF)-like protein/PAS domain S-box-containing protein
VTAESPVLTTETRPITRDPAPSGGTGRFGRVPVLPIVLGGVAAGTLVAAMAVAGMSHVAPWWGQLQLTLASVAAVAVLARGAALGQPGLERDFRFNILAAAAFWLGIQLVWLAQAARPGLQLGPLESLLLAGWVVTVARCWRLSLRGRLSVVETTAVYLDSAAVFLTVAATVLLIQGRRALEDPRATDLLAYTVLIGGAIGAITVLYLALTPVRRASGWLFIVGGLVAIGTGLALRIEARPAGWQAADVLVALGIMVTAYACATWTDETDPNERVRRIAERVRGGLPLVAVAVAPALIVINQLALPANGERVGLAVDVAMALVLIVCVVRQTLMLRERSRLLAVAHDAALRERELVGDLQAREERFRTLVQNSTDVVLVLAPDGTVAYQSPAVERVLGYAPDERMGRQVFELTHPDDIDFVRGVMAELMASPGATRTIELRSRHADGSWRTIEATGKNLLDDPVIGGIVVNYRDVSERKDLERQLVHEAFHDPLTGLSNRALFTDRVEHALTRRDELERLTVLFLDIDDFKTINDSLGHGAGDLVLVAVAERVRACLRPEDTVSRLGGDEFAVLLEGADAALALQVAGRLLASIRMPFEIGGKQVHLEASIGAAFGNPETRNASELLRNADAAMYTAKNRGKGRVQVFELSMHAAALTRLELKADLERALADDELRLRYQPVFNLRDGSLAGFEALLRWRHPTRGEILPGEFIGLAEETGMIVQIGRWVLEQACRQAKAWTDAGSDAHIGVNLSARQLREPDFVEVVAGVLHDTGLPAAQLTLELTESSLMQDDEGRLKALHALGLQLALDDFGTGYSSLSYLARFPIDIIKIDRSFTAELGAEMEESALVRSVIQLAAAMNMRTVAEGIERPEQLARVTSLGCDFGQGYLLARPMDAIRATALVAVGVTISTVGEVAS